MSGCRDLSYINGAVVAELRGAHVALSTQQFADLVAGLRSETNRGRGHELRSATRIEVNCRIVIWPILDTGKVGEAQTVLARDVSLTGLGILTSVPLEAGAQFITGLPRPRLQPLMIRYVVRHSRELSDGIHAIGGSFEQVLSRAGASPASPSQASPVLAMATA